MKILSPALAAHLASGATTLCWCWRLTRRDGSRLGFTDHDRDLSFDGTNFEAAAGFTASEMRDAVGLSVDNMEVESALSSARLEESDIVAGLYDDAVVEIFRVDWSAPDNRVLMRSGSLGEVRRNGLAFTAEVRGLSHYLQQSTGRLYQYGCDADLGDARCKIDLGDARWRGAGTISAVVAGRVLTVSGLDAFASGWFARGLLTFTSGANSGRAFEVKRHAGGAGVVTVELWQEPSDAVAIGDTFVVAAGCDKQISTCAGKFANITNFRGFAQMPGNDFVTTVARPGSTASRSGG